MYPSVMQLFWERLKGATQTESFLEDAMPSAVRAATIAISERVYRDISDWYQPGYQIDVNEAQRHQIQIAFFLSEKRRERTKGTPEL